MATLNVACILAESAYRKPEKVAVVEGHRRTTFGDLWLSARAVAGALIDRGVEPGDRVALLAPNVTDFIQAYYGILAAGATVVPVPALLAGPEAGFLLSASGAKTLLYHPALAPLAQAAAEEADVPAEEIAPLTHFDTPVERYATRSPEDIAVIFFTSGTTGVPKGAMLSHLNVVLNVLNASYDTTRMTETDIIMGCLPLFHVYGQQSAMNTALRTGATLVLQPRFEARTCLELMREEGATVLLAVPTMYVQLLAAAKAPGAEPPPQLSSCISGGASLPVSVLEEFDEVFGTHILEGYGMSETSPTIAVNQDRFGTKPGTVGHSTWGNEIEIADQNVQDSIVFLPDGERGEIVVRGHSVFTGYLNDPEATKAAVVDGWFRSGDIGIKDEEGFVRIVDRTKDLIIRGGYNVYPRDVEEVFMRHPAVNMAAVVGVPDDEYGEEVCAFLTLAPGADVTVDDLLAYGRESLGKHKYPRRIELIDEMPMGPSMKILKRELRKNLLDRPRDPDPPRPR